MPGIFNWAKCRGDKKECDPAEKPKYRGGMSIAQCTDYLWGKQPEGLEEPKPKCDEPEPKCRCKELREAEAGAQQPKCGGGAPEPQPKCKGKGGPPKRCEKWL